MRGILGVNSAFRLAVNGPLSQALLWSALWALAITMLPDLASSLPAIHSNNIFLGGLREIQPKPLQKAITRIAIVGERHSGTNFLFRLIQENLAGPPASAGSDGSGSMVAFSSSNATAASGGETGSSPVAGASPPAAAPAVSVTDYFCQGKHYAQWRHIQCSLDIERDFGHVLAVVITRNPYDWTFSMHRECWCGYEESPAIARKKFRVFISDRWPQEVYMKKPVGWTWNWAKEEAEGRGFVDYDNVLQARACKLAGHLHLASWVPHIEFVRHEDIYMPEVSISWVSRLFRRYGIQGKPNLTAICQFKFDAGTFDKDEATGRSVYLNRTLLMTNSTLRRRVRMINRRLYQEVEAAAGYGVIGGQEREEQEGIGSELPLPPLPAWCKTGIRDEVLSS